METALTYEYEGGYEYCTVHCWWRGSGTGKYRLEGLARDVIEGHKVGFTLIELLEVPR